MFTSLLLGTALAAPAAPVPPDTVPAPTGPAPKVVFLKADAGGQVWVAGVSYEKRKITQTIVQIVNGQQQQRQEEREVNVPTYVRKTVQDLGGKYATAGGETLTPGEAAARVKDGAVVLIAADGKPVDKGWLRAVNPDTVVIAAESLGGLTLQNAAPQVPGTPAPRLVLLAADAGDGKVRVGYSPGVGNTTTAYYGDNVEVMQARFLAIAQQQRGLVDLGGSVAPTQPGTSGSQTRPLDELKFEAFDLTGRSVPRAEAVKRLKAGGLVLVAHDRLPDETYLKAFKGDVLVLVSADLIAPETPIAKPGVAAPVPVAPAIALPAVGALKQVAPAIQIAPALPAPPPAKKN